MQLRCEYLSPTGMMEATSRKLPFSLFLGFSKRCAGNLARGCHCPQAKIGGCGNIRHPFHKGSSPLFQSGYHYQGPRPRRASPLSHFQL